MKSIGDRKITIKLQEIKDIPPEVPVGTINKVVIINVATHPSRGRGYDPQGGNFAKKVGTINNSDVHCFLCGLKGLKVATCRKLPKAQELLRKDKQWYWNEKKAAGRNNASRYTRKHQINEVDEADSINNEGNQYDEEDVNTDYEGIEEINFPYSEFTEEEDLAYYNDK